MPLPPSSPRPKPTTSQAMRPAGKTGIATLPTPQSRIKRWKNSTAKAVTTLTVLLSALWLIAALWYQLHQWALLCWPLILGVVILALALIISSYNSRYSIKRTNNSRCEILGVLYAIVWLIGLAWFISIPAKQDRDWKPEVAHILSYERDANNPDLVTLHNVRNFDWQSEDKAVEHWQSRQVDLAKLNGVDVVNAYWMGPAIAHTLVSFHFVGERPLSFSFEIRKEQHEDFSAIGGFFKQYELSLIASEERDIIYTRTNARGEQVYLFPISNLTQSELRAMFEAYLKAADDLQAKPTWYNTLTSNCTNIIFYMAQAISNGDLPWDYRIWASGWLPNYLYEVGMLPKSSKAGAIADSGSVSGEVWTMSEWYKQAHINPKVAQFSAKDNQPLDTYSKLIRQGLPKAKLIKADKRQLITKGN